MGKKSRSKKEWRTREERMYVPPPIIADLINEFFDADLKFEEGAHTVLFRHQLATRGSLRNCVDNEVQRLGIDEEEFGIAWTHMWNTPPEDFYDL